MSSLGVCVIDLLRIKGWIHTAKVCSAPVGRRFSVFLHVTGQTRHDLWVGKGKRSTESGAHVLVTLTALVGDKSVTSRCGHNLRGKEALV